MKTFLEATRPYLQFLGVILVFVGCVAIFWAWMNLIGVPMLESSAMHPRQGWISVGIAVISLTLAAWIFRRKRWCRRPGGRVGQTAITIPLLSESLSKFQPTEDLG